jgi:phosphate transport system substrate-binding protein
VISRKWLNVAGVAVVLTLGLTACGDDPAAGENGGGGNEELAGTIVIDGSSTVAPLSEAAAELFMGENPGIQVTVATSGTGGGFERFCRGETDISDASRPIEEDEVAACEGTGVVFEELTVANDALSVLVNPENPVDCLTVEQLAAIWDAGSTLSNWSEIPGLAVDFDEPVDLYGPGTTSGTYDYFNEVITGEDGQRSEGYSDIGENDNTGITGIEGSLGGMFYVGYSYYLENQDRVKALQIDGGGGCVEPALETVLDGTYTPLSRPLFIYPSDVALERPEVQAFVQFYIENGTEIAEARGFVGLTEEQAAESQAELERLIGG